MEVHLLLEVPGNWKRHSELSDWLQREIPRAFEGVTVREVRFVRRGPITRTVTLKAVEAALAEVGIEQDLIQQLVQRLGTA